MEKVNTLVVDKTGTLTEDKPRLVTVQSADGFDEQRILQLAANLERSSEHPLTEAIVRQASERDIKLFEKYNYRVFACYAISIKACCLRRCPGLLRAKAVSMVGVPEGRWRRWDTVARISRKRCIARRSGGEEDLLISFPEPRLGRYQRRWRSPRTGPA